MEVPDIYVWKTTENSMKQKPIVKYLFKNIIWCKRNEEKSELVK